MKLCLLALFLFILPALAGDEKALIAAINAHPEDDTVRLVYADWLDEHNQAARAEFIRLQIHMEGLGKASEEWRRAKTRQDELIAQYEDEWLPGFREFKRRYKDLELAGGLRGTHLIWSRGFPGSLWIPAQAVTDPESRKTLNAFPALHQMAIGGHLEGGIGTQDLRGVTSEAFSAAAAELSLLSNVRDLRLITQGYFSAADLKRVLTQASRLWRFETNVDYGHDQGDERLAVLLESPSASTLRSLSLHYPNPYALDRIAGSGKFNLLERIEFGLGPISLSGLTDSSKNPLPALRVLDFRYHRAEVDALIRFTKSPVFRELKSFATGIENGAPIEVIAGAFADSPHQLVEVTIGDRPWNALPSRLQEQVRANREKEANLHCFQLTAAVAYED